MAIDLASGAGLFDKLGKLKLLLNLINTTSGDESTGWPKELNDALAEYDGESNAVRDTVRDLISALTAAQQGTSILKEAIRTAAQQTLIVVAHTDDPLPEQTVQDALALLIQQMRAAGATIDASEPSAGSLVRGPRTGSISAATSANPVEITSNGHGLSTGERISIAGAAGMTEINGLEFTVDVSDANTFELVGVNGAGYGTYTSGAKWQANVGSGVLRLSVLDGLGQRLENILAEDIVCTCNDSSSAGGEAFLCRGEEGVTDKLSHLWPAGSGANETIDASEAADSLLLNGDFEAFAVTDTPDDWTIDVGTVTTHIKEENTNLVRGTSSLEFVGDASTLIKISQALELAARTPYAMNLYALLDVVPAAGVLQVDLFDGTNVIVDESGNANSLVIDLTAENTFFSAHGTYFRLPDPLPASVQLRVHLTTALSSGSSLFLDELSLKEADRLYDGTGPYAALFAGASDFALDDEFVATIVNAREGALQEMCDQFFGTSEAGVLLPSATGAAETIADSLIS